MPARPLSRILATQDQTVFGNVINLEEDDSSFVLTGRKVNPDVVGRGYFLTDVGSTLPVNQSPGIISRLTAIGASGTIVSSKKRTRSEELPLYVEHRLAELFRLPATWDERNALPPNAMSLANARQVAKAFQRAELPVPLITPSVEEGVCLSLRKGRFYADIECLNSGEFVAGLSDGSQDHTAWEVDERELTEVAELFSQHLGR